MSGFSYLAVFALLAMVICYAFEERSRLALLGFCAASVIAALSEFILRHWSFGIVALGFTGAALERWYVGRRRDGRV